MIGKFITDNVKRRPVGVYRKRQRSLEVSLPECLTTRNFHLPNKCSSQRKGPSLAGCQTDQVIAMESREIPSLAGPARATKQNKFVQGIRIEGNSLCSFPTHESSKGGTSESDENDSDYQNGHDETGSRCNPKKHGIVSRARSLDSIPFHEMSEKVENESLPSFLLAQRVDSNTRSYSVAVSSIGKETRVRKMREKRRIPPIQSTKKLAPLVQSEKAQMMSIEGTQCSGKTSEKFHENSTGINLLSHPERCETNKEVFNNCYCQSCPTEMRDVTFDKQCSEKKAQSSEQGKSFSLPAIVVSHSTDKYKSRFRVKLLPLVTKSDSLPDLAESSSTQSVQLLVTTSLTTSTPALHLKDIHETAEEGVIKREDDEAEEGFASKRGRARSLSLDSAFPGDPSFAKGGREIAIDGSRLLPEIKAGPVGKKSSLSPLKAGKKPDKMWSSQGPTLPWR